MDIIRSIFHYIRRWLCCCFPFLCRKKSLRSNDLKGLAEALKESKSVIVMTGAGISTNSGIPDFRSESFGLYNRLQKYNLSNPTDVFSLAYFKQDPRPFYDIAHSLYPTLLTAKPTVAHYFIKLLDQKGILLRHYTQNIDSLEDLTGLDENKTVQAHGHIRSGTCLNCTDKYSFDYMKNFVLKNEVPKCETCHSNVKPDVVLFGEGLPSRFWKNLTDFPKCDLLIIMGTSLVVQPFAGLANKVDYNVPRLLINKDDVGDPNMLGSALTSLLGLNPNFNKMSNAHRDVFYQGDCDEGCMELVYEMGWDHDLKEMIMQKNREIEIMRKNIQSNVS